MQNLRSVAALPSSLAQPPRRRARAFFVFALSLSLARSRDATRHKLRSQINNAAVLLVPSRPCSRHYRRRSSPVAVYYGPGTLSVAWNAGSVLHGFGPESFHFTNCCLLQSARTLSIAWNAGSLLDGFGLESSSLPIATYYYYYYYYGPGTLGPFWTDLVRNP